MSTAKRSRQRHSEAGAAASLPPAKKAKTASKSDVLPGLDFLTDERQRAGKALKATLTNGTNDAARSKVDESRAVIAGNDASADDDVDMGDAVGEADGDSSDAQDSSDDEVDVDELVKTRSIPKKAAITNGNVGIDEDDDVKETTLATRKKQGAQSNGLSAEDIEESEDVSGPSFGDLLHAAHPETIDVPAAFATHTEPKSQLSTDHTRSLPAPSATSLGTVLTQALRTNDKELLESCLQTKDANSIRATIQRLQSPLVATLLQRLAERLHKRPGRAGPLMVWVTWSLVAHGGYLASQPQVTKKLQSLHQVVRERANSLQSLMTLKGKLDMLSAQIELRRGMQAQRSAQDESDDEDNVIYIEGEEDESSDEASNDDEIAAPARKSRGRTSKKSRQIEAGAHDSESEDDIEDVAMANGIEDDVEDDSEDGEDEDGNEEGLIDDEAEETDDDEGEATSEEDESADDLEEDEDDDESVSEDEAPTVKRTKPLQRAGLARRK